MGVRSEDRRGTAHHWRANRPRCVARELVSDSAMPIGSSWARAIVICASACCGWRDTRPDAVAGDCSTRTRWLPRSAWDRWETAGRPGSDQAAGDVRVSTSPYAGSVPYGGARMSTNRAQRVRPSRRYR